MGKKETLRYVAYKSGKFNRIKGPGGLDIHLEAYCPGCVALYMTLAYERGRQDATKHNRRH